MNAKALKLAPAGDAITDERYAATAAGLVTLPDGFVAQGWLDSRTVVGRQLDGSLSYIRLDSPQTVHDLGFKGRLRGDTARQLIAACYPEPVPVGSGPAPGDGPGRGGPTLPA